MIKIMRADFRGTDLTTAEKYMFHSAYKQLLLLKRREWRSIFLVYDEEERNEIFDDAEPMKN